MTEITTAIKTENLLFVFGVAINKLRSKLLVIIVALFIAIQTDGFFFSLFCQY